jgi:pyruvate carboxylase
VIFELNGASRTAVRIKNTSVRSSIITRFKTEPAVIEQIGTCVMGFVLETKAKKGDAVKAGDALIVLSAMQMETMISAPASGTIKVVEVVEVARGAM